MPTGTILRQLSTTALADNTAITTSNAGFNGSGGAAGSGNTAVYLAAAAMAEPVGYRLTQAGANVNQWYMDHTAPIAQFSLRLPFRYSATPTANCAWLRFYPDTGHATNLGGFLITTTNRLQFLEGSGTTPLNVTSASGTPLVPGNDYVLMCKIDVSTDAFETKVYPRGSTTPLFTMTGTLGGIMASAAGIQSLRYGIATASSLAQLNTNSAFAIGSGDYLARTDVSNIPPTCNAGTDFAVEAGQPFSLGLDAVDNDTDGAIASRAWTWTGGTVGTTLIVAGLTAPISLTDENRTYTYTVTDDQGATATDTVVVTMLAATRRVRSGGVVRPVVHRIKS